MRMAMMQLEARVTKGVAANSMAGSYYDRLLHEREAWPHVMRSPSDLTRRATERGLLRRPRDGLERQAEDGLPGERVGGPRDRQAARALEVAQDLVGGGVERARRRHRRIEGGQVLLEPDHLVALVALGQCG